MSDKKTEAESAAHQKRFKDALQKLIAAPRSEVEKREKEFAQKVADAKKRKP